MCGPHACMVSSVVCVCVCVCVRVRTCVCALCRSDSVTVE